MNQYELAVEHLNKAIELYNTWPIYTDVPADRDEGIARSYHQLGRLHKNCDHYNDAQTVLDLALKMRQDTWYNNDDLTYERHRRLALARAHTYEVLGIIHVNKSKYHEALKNFEETLTLRQKYLPANHFYIADIYNNFSLAHSKMGNSNESLVYLEKALDIQRQSLPSNHPNLATMYNNIGATHWEACQYDKALPYFKEAQRIAKIAPYGSIHTKLELTIMSNYASGLRTLNKYDEALVYYNKALLIAQRMDKNNPVIISLLNNIGFIHSDKGDKLRAVQYFTKALPLCQQIFGENHVLTATTYKSLGDELEIDEYDRAMSYFQRVFDIHDHLNLPYHRNVIDSLVFKGRLHRKMHEHDLALEIYKKSLALAEKHYPEDHPLVIRSCSYVALALTDHGDDYLLEAVNMYERALKLTSPNDPERARMQRLLDDARQRINV
ncbi:unnamed protein product [Rotaria sordida]|uniref:Kinesin light chain n=1 Tax=Rotaria sordida TaxID=392033 RepID=A0A814RY30_9BILA|nr:unnamed protein product [Rotaria sordida]CAF1369994.1 unnamed protein product [Rotaria sordida]